MRKPQITKINLSTPFPTRARCKYCGKHPELYYHIREPHLTVDPNQALQGPWMRFIKMIAAFTTDYYLSFDPIEFKTVSDFAHKLLGSKYNPKLHKNKGIPADNKTEYLICGYPCGKSIWAFTDKSISKRPEILNRKARTTFPKKIDSY